MMTSGTMPGDAQTLLVVKGSDGGNGVSMGLFTQSN